MNSVTPDPLDAAAPVVDIIKQASFDDLRIEDLAAMIARVASAPKPRYVLRGVMAETDYGVLAGKWKVGKTWLATDLAVSVASGTPWLGVFEVDAPGPVLLFAGEGGDRKIVRRFHAVCESRNFEPADLDIRISQRVPHLNNEVAMLLVEAEVAATRPRLVILDPLYLAAHGAQGSSIIEMGANLERIQVVCQRHGAALLIFHHWNQTGRGQGPERMAGAGAEAWGRVLISAVGRSNHTNEETATTTAVLDIDLEGDEIADRHVRIQRVVWADDPDDLTSPLHYDVTQMVRSAKAENPAVRGHAPSVEKVLAVVEKSDSWLTVKDVTKELSTSGSALKERTVQHALKELVQAELVDYDGGRGATGGKWRAIRAHSTDLQTENGS